jgi:adenosylcobyric acid synthase
MFVGTGSEVGKSVIATAFCRILKTRGFRVAPFKAQNMALNSFVTAEGGEMGRAQVVQAEACGIDPHIDMNPVLLKPSSDTGSQVIIHGTVFKTMGASQYYRFKKQIWKKIAESYHRLSRTYDVLVLEGAGSVAEVNLKDRDVVNMRMAEEAEARVVLVADIDRGGVFASIVGTMHLLTPRERRRIVGFVINKFRGDRKLLKPGLSFLEKETGKPVLGVIPYLNSVHIPGEDSVQLARKTKETMKRTCKRARVGVVKLPHLSNYTDFDPLETEASISLGYLNAEEKLKGKWNLLVLPGSKNTIQDLKYLKDVGFAEQLRKYHARGGKILGICGGFQMLGQHISDPSGVESSTKNTEGLGLLPMRTVLASRKITAQVQATAEGLSVGLPFAGHTISGYEIHMGRSSLPPTVTPFATITRKSGSRKRVRDGAVSKDLQTLGTYIHGLFEEDGFRRAFLNWVVNRRGPSDEKSPRSYRLFKDKQYDLLAQHVEKHVNLKRILGATGLSASP